MNMDFTTKGFLITLLKVAVLALALNFILGYISDYDLRSVFSRISGATIIAAFFVSAAGMLSLSGALYALSGYRIPLADCLSIDFYTMLLNIGVTSSFFSLPKIALIKRSMGDTKESARLFVAHTAVGMSARLLMLLVGFAAVLVGLLPLIAAALASAAVAFMAARGRTASRVVPRLLAVALPNITVKTAAIAFAMGVFAVLCTSASQYLLISGLGGSSPSFAQMLFAEQAGVISGFVSPVPAGLGVREVVITESMASFNVGRESVFLGAVAARLLLILSLGFCAGCAHLTRRLIAPKRNVTAPK